jgi:two-component system CheB/CheR fusion protein
MHGELLPGPLWITADATRLTQAIGNLLQNAVKFTPAGGRVMVSLTREGETAVVRVEDNGIGIAPEVLPHLFVPFTQGDRTLDRSSGGLGLGLALTKALVELHGGEAQASSRGPGQGAEITLRIPTAPELPVAAPPPSTAGQGRQRRILLIEDNQDAAVSLQEALRFDGHEVVVASSGPQGVKKARAQAPDVVLCDIGLPGMDGYAVARAFRADEGLRHIPLIALTGYASAEDQKKADAAGFDRHLAKPVDLGALAGILAELPGE